jgi:hypothetical protein
MHLRPMVQVRRLDMTPSKKARRLHDGHSADHFWGLVSAAAKRLPVLSRGFSQNGLDSGMTVSGSARAGSTKTEI